MKSLSTASHFNLSLAMVSQVVSLVRSLLSLLDLSRCKWVLMSPSHRFASFPCFQDPLCLVDIAGFQLETTLVQRSK